uniref:Uncharacterized protein n=1 Tax=viral metagenome TaxID=1070528 RepID=A0A6C0E945_9ZZZZ
MKEKSSDMPKRRGRPKKSSDKYNYSSDSGNEDEGIILQLPCGNDSDKNHFTMDETDSEVNDIQVNLLDELQKRDQLIAEMRRKIELYENDKRDNVISVTKDLKTTVIDLKCVNIHNKKPVVVDKTDICCWWCTEHFNTLPVFLPDRYSNGTYYVFGVFCSFSCAKAYNMRSMGDYKVDTRNALLQKMYMKIFNNTKEIICAPCRELHQKFGGPISAKEFTDPSYIMKKDRKMDLPPIVPLLSVLEESTKDTKIKKNNIICVNSETGHKITNSSNKSTKSEEKPKTIKKAVKKVTKDVKKKSAD